MLGLRNSAGFSFAARDATRTGSGICKVCGFIFSAKVELALLKSILDAEEISSFVKNDNFGSLEVGPRIGLFNAKMIEVKDDQHEKAAELLSDYLGKVKEKSDESGRKYSFFDKIRMVIEGLIFGWIMPGRRKTGRDESGNQQQ